MLKSISKNLVDHTGHGIADWLNSLSNLSTTIGIFVALAGGWQAYRSYQAALESSANGHMHSLFRDYLRMRMDYDLESTRGSQLESSGTVSSNPTLISLASAKLYVIEEMWVWIDRQRRSRGAKRLERASQLAAWEATVLPHVLDDYPETRRLLLDFTSCYSSGFLCFVATYIDDEELERKAKDAAAADREGKSRELGDEEAIQRARAKSQERGITCGN